MYQFMLQGKVWHEVNYQKSFHKMSLMPSCLEIIEQKVVEAVIK